MPLHRRQTSDRQNHQFVVGKAELPAQSDAIHDRREARAVDAVIEHIEACRRDRAQAGEPFRGVATDRKQLVGGQR